MSRRRSLLGHVKRRCHAGAARRGDRWTAAESAALQRAHAARPSAWTAIARELGRTPGACRDRYRTLFGDPTPGVAPAAPPRTGPWEPDEEARLLAFAGSSATGDVAFGAAARAVGTRSRLQCSRKWGELRPSSAPRHLDTAAERLALCEALVARGVTDESDVTWTELGWDVPGTATTVALSGWRRLRRRYPELDFPAALARCVADLRDEVRAAG